MAFIGNGVIGHGIAEIFAKGRWHVCLIGRSQDSLAKATDRIRSSLDEFVEAGVLLASAGPPVMSRISTSIALEQQAPNADLARGQANLKKLLKASLLLPEDEET